MKGNGFLLKIAVTYMILLLAASLFYLFKGTPNYLTYRSEIKAVEQKINQEETKQQEELEDKPVEEENNKDKEVETVNPPENTYDTVQYSRLISLGVQGEDVNRVQYLLKKKNFYNGEITGTFDVTTRTAVIDFQTANQLGADGMIGMGTWTELIE
jgi:peptidoglycan hydrolase-like protein with peptidoglycan-binding domain